MEIAHIEPAVQRARHTSTSPGDTPVPVTLPLLLVTHPLDTFTMRMKGDAMTGAHIPDGALLIVDTAGAPYNGAIVVASINGEYTVRIYERSTKSIRLLSAGKHYSPLPITDGMDFQVVGVITRVILVMDR